MSKYVPTIATEILLIEASIKRDRAKAKAKKFREHTLMGFEARARFKPEQHQRNGR